MYCRYGEYKIVALPLGRKYVSIERRPEFDIFGRMLRASEWEHLPVEAHQYYDEVNNRTFEVCLAIDHVDRVLYVAHGGEWEIFFETGAGYSMTHYASVKREI